jgi:large subunit ribosomal protein L18
MATNKKDRIKAHRRVLRVRSRIKRYGMPPRVSVFRSSNHIYAQIIDDMNSKTLASSSSLGLGIRGNKENAYAVGLDLAKKAKAQGIDAVVFDRGRFKYHGRVAALADGLREGTLKF